MLLGTAVTKNLSQLRSLAALDDFQLPLPLHIDDDPPALGLVATGELDNLP